MILAHSDCPPIVSELLEYVIDTLDHRPFNETD